MVQSDVLHYADYLNAGTVGWLILYAAVLEEKQVVMWSRSQEGHDEQANMPEQR